MWWAAKRETRGLCSSAFAPTHCRTDHFHLPSVRLTGSSYTIWSRYLLRLDWKQLLTMLQLSTVTALTARDTESSLATTCHSTVRLLLLSVVWQATFVCCCSYVVKSISVGDDMLLDICALHSAATSALMLATQLLTLCLLSLQYDEKRRNALDCINLCEASEAQCLMMDVCWPWSYWVTAIKD